MDQNERIEALEDAREAIYQAVENIRQAVSGTAIKQYAEAYIIPSLLMSASREHDYIGRHTNIDDLISALEGDGSEE